MIDAEILRAEARAAAARAYAPFSHFRVGAAVLADGRLHVGCNIENASYGLTMCAERVAIFSAIAAGARRIDAIAVSCVDATPDSPPGFFMPCGACRQVMAEFAPPETMVIVDGIGVFTLDELLPKPFRLS